MSMISAQIDELRERAKVLRQGRWSDGADDARLMEDAADTIWQLRDDLQRTNAENAKLRELLQRLLTEYRYMRVRPRAVYLQHEERMRAIEEEMRELGIEVDG